jgi:TonB family protein
MAAWRHGGMAAWRHGGMAARPRGRGGASRPNAYDFMRHVLPIVDEDIEPAGVPRKGESKATWSLVASAVAHLVILGGVGFVAYRSLGEKERLPAEVPASAGSLSGDIPIDLPMMTAGDTTADSQPVPEGEVPSTFGGAAVARIDNGAAGSGGDVTGARATNLAALDDGMKRDVDLVSRLDRDQVQRLKTARFRTTHEDRRSTTHPMELTFLASGKGDRPERRPDSPSDPSRGSLLAASPSVVGGHPGATAAADPSDADIPGDNAGARQEGQLLGSPGVGVRDGSPGRDHRRGARITYARPSVTEGAPTIPGIWNGRPNDTVDSDQEVANTVKSLVQASTAGGRAGDGRGGSASPAADPGAGGGSAARGSIARPLGTGDGELVDWNTSDPMLLPYFRRIHAKVDPLWAHAFPKSAMLELKQGTVILEFTIAADGTAKVAWPPVRPSGIDEFDRNCADAVRRASPFDPLPQALLDAGRTSLKIRAPFIAKNPIVK